MFWAMLNGTVEHSQKYKWDLWHFYPVDFPGMLIKCSSIKVYFKYTESIPISTITITTNCHTDDHV